MTAYRYLAYKRIQRSLARIGDHRLNAETVELLRDMAEGLLLARDHEIDEAEELETSAALALSLLVGTSHLTDAEADSLWRGMNACGPLPADDCVPRAAMSSNTGISWPGPDARSASPSA